MSASVIVIPPTSSKFPDASAARKRRREILASQRQAIELTTAFVSKSSIYEGQSKKPRRVSDLTEPSTPLKSSLDKAVVEIMNNKKNANPRKKNASKKKPQMKYDPDVPMSKEEAAAWRREQRRKRNRESAALSRQRQRDRIGDLEVEVEQWKTKVESILERIKSLEDATGIDSKSLVPHLSEQESILEQSSEFENDGTTDGNGSKFVSPPPSPTPGRNPLHKEARASPITSCAKTVVDAVVDQVLMGIESYEQEFTDNMISRHATS